MKPYGHQKTLTTLNNIVNAKRALIISSTFFPDQTVAAVRVSQWAKYLPEFDWHPTVACRYRGVSASASELSDNLHESVKVQYLDRPRTSSDVASPRDSKRRKPSRFRQTIVDCLAKLSVPDISIWSWKKLLPKVYEITNQQHFDVVITSSPPHSIHFVGMQLAKKTGIPWVADFRDPFLDDIRFQPSGISRLLSSRFGHFEKQIACEADACLFAIKHQFERFNLRYPDFSDRFHFLPNGFPFDMPLNSSRQSPEKQTTIRMMTAGVISGEAVTFLSQLATSLQKNNISLCFDHYGPVPKNYETNTTDENSIKFHGLVSHRKVLHEMISCHALFVFSSAERAQCGGLSSKLFEYLATGLPVAVIRPTIADQDFVADYPWVTCFSEPDVGEMSKFLTCVANGAVACDQQLLDDYRATFNRRRQTQQLGEVLDQLFSGQGASDLGIALK